MMVFRRTGVSEVLIVGLLMSWTAAASAASREDTQADSDRLAVYVGTYTGGNSKGIYLFHLDPATGGLQSAGLAAAVPNPSFLAVHPNRQFVYAVSEIGNFAGGKTGAVSALAIDRKTGKLTLLNQQASRGTGPCHLVVDRTGRYVLVANYGSGSVACLPIEADGRLGAATCAIQHEGSSVNRRRQEGPHAHCVRLDAANRFALVADLGLDKILVYRFDAGRGELAANDPPSARVAAGAGPRHLVFHPRGGRVWHPHIPPTAGRYAYVINELSSTVTGFEYDSNRGVLKPLQTISTLPEGFRGENTAAEVQVHPSGRFLYGSNRGHDSIAIFAIDVPTGRLRHVGNESTGGKTPRNFVLDPTGTYLLAANQATDDIVVFRIDAETGRLNATGRSVSVPSPVCVEIMRPGS